VHSVAARSLESPQGAAKRHHEGVELSAKMHEDVALAGLSLQRTRVHSPDGRAECHRRLDFVYEGSRGDEARSAIALLPFVVVCGARSSSGRLERV